MIWPASGLSCCSIRKAFEIGAEVVPIDPPGLAIPRYPDRLAAANADSEETDALVVVVQGAIKTVPVVIACFEFEFLGGSMGSAVTAVSSVA